MRDFYNDGFNDGYSGKTYGDREYPRSDGDSYSYRNGLEDGMRRRDVSRELDREMYGDDY